MHPQPGQERGWSGPAVNRTCSRAGGIPPPSLPWQIHPCKRPSCVNEAVSLTSQGPGLDPEATPALHSPPSESCQVVNWCPQHHPKSQEGRAWAGARVSGDTQHPSCSMGLLSPTEASSRHPGRALLIGETWGTPTARVWGARTSARPPKRQHSSITPGFLLQHKAALAGRSSSALPTAWTKWTGIEIRQNKIITEFLSFNGYTELVTFLWEFSWLCSLFSRLFTLFL